MSKQLHLTVINMDLNILLKQLQNRDALQCLSLGKIMAFISWASALKRNIMQPQSLAVRWMQSVTATKLGHISDFNLKCECAATLPAVLYFPIPIQICCISQYKDFLIGSCSILED